MYGLYIWSDFITFFTNYTLDIITCLVLIYVGFFKKDCLFVVEYFRIHQTEKMLELQFFLKSGQKSHRNCKKSQFYVSMFRLNKGQNLSETPRPGISQHMYIEYRISDNFHKNKILFLKNKIVTHFKKRRGFAGKIRHYKLNEQC